jgi:hypothetical protein
VVLRNSLILYGMGKVNIKFEVEGKPDSDFNKYLKTRSSVKCNVEYFREVAHTSKTNAKSVSASDCVKDMLYIMRLLKILLSRFKNAIGTIHR